MTQTATVFRDVHARKASRVPLAPLLEAIEAGKPHRDSKAECPLFSAFTFGDRRTPKGSLRSTDNALHAWAVVAEHDAGTIAPELARDKLAAFGIAATVYTTASHTREAPRWRIVAPTARELDKGEYPHMVARINGLFGGAIARESFTVAQSFYFGRVNGRDFAAYRTAGAHIDELDELDGGALYPEGAASGEDSAPLGATDDDLRDTIRTGADGVQRALLALAARLIGRGMAADDATAVLAGLLDACEWKDREPDRWHTRRDSIARCVRTACEKFGDRRTRSEGDATPQQDGAGRQDSALPSENFGGAGIAAAHYPRPRDFWAATPEAAPLDVGGTLPVPLADIAAAIADARGHDPGMIAGALLAALSACIVQPSRIVPHEGGTWREGSALWVGLIGESGRGKSPSMALATAPLDTIEKAAFAQWKEAGGDATPDNPEPERIIARDTTLEALIAAHARATHRLLVCKDEGTAWLNGMGQYNGRAEAERGAWCSAWNCAPFNVDRITRRALRFDDWGASLLIGITPRQIKEAAEDARADGLLARVLPVLVRAPQESAPSPAEGRAEAALRELARTMHALPEIAATLAPQAREHWQAEADKARDLALDLEASNPALASWLRKFAANALRVVLTFAAINTAAHRSRFAANLTDRLALVVNADEMRRALALVGWFAQSAAAFFEGAAPDPARDLARELALLIAYRLHRDPEEHPRIARRDFERHRLRAWARADEPTRERAVLVLHDAGWLLGAAGRPGSGIRLGQATAWAVNPTVREAFTELAQTEAERRRAIRDRLTSLGRLPASEDA